MKYMVEDHNEKLMQIIFSWPEEIKTMVAKDNLQAFKEYSDFCNPINKEQIAAYIFYNYVIDGRLFGPAAVADYVLEALDLLELQEFLPFIEKLYKHYENGMRHMFLDAIRVLIRLFIGTMTVDDVIKEENEFKEYFKKNINKYLEYLNNGIDFEDLYFAMMYDYSLLSKGELQTDISSVDDAIHKVKALYCANHIYNNKK